MAIDKHIKNTGYKQLLSAFTPARVGLGRAGTSIPTNAYLDFQLAHAQAIDAVHAALDVEALCEQASATAVLRDCLPALRLHSAAMSRMQYLQRPDLGRELNEESIYRLQQISEEKPYDLVFVIADGLSATAIAHNAIPFLAQLITNLRDSDRNWKIGPLCIVEQARVAVGDDVCASLNAREVIILIGERPGLSSPDSLGIYLTYHPYKGVSDALRNCISNVRPAGLSYAAAASLCQFLIEESFNRSLSGTKLKDRTAPQSIGRSQARACFLLANPAEGNADKID